MHDPMTIAFDIPRPWPERSTMSDAKPGQPRWQIRLHHQCGEHCGTDQAKHAARNPFPWWKPRSYSSFWVLAGRGWYWPTLITIWHNEPGGHDSGKVCKTYTRITAADGTVTTKYQGGWRWHAHHWSIQLHPLQALRRWLLTRCAWCGGRSRKGDRVDNSHSWDGPRGKWWQGEPGLYHRDCSSVSAAWLTCVCERPACDNYSREHGPYGMCARCGKQRGFGQTDARTDRLRILANIPRGQRDPAAYKQICDMVSAEAEPKPTPSTTA
jgi:hypothetical protein